MPVYKTHISILDDTTAKHPEVVALKIPQLDTTGGVLNWKNITYRQFLVDVEKAGRYWAHELSKSGLSQRSSVTLWTSGKYYIDAVHIWGISRAGHIPHLVTTSLTSPEVVFELIHKVGSKALIVEASHLPHVSDRTVPVLPAVDILGLDVADLPLPERWNPSSPEDLIMTMHSSGSTSTIPKIVPMKAKWFDFSLTKMAIMKRAIHSSSDQLVMVRNGVFSHMSGVGGLMNSTQGGDCLVLPSVFPYSTHELQRLVQECNASSIGVFSSTLSKFIQEARTNSDVLATLKGLRSVLCGGMSLEAAEEEWAREQNINAVKLFGSTEVGFFMASIPGKGPDAGTYRLIPGGVYNFVPTPDDEALLELRVPPESLDCPDASLRDKGTGDYHTGDFFSEFSPGRYIERGRMDDFIKMDNSGSCDTKSLEDNVRQVADDLVSAVVAVGSGRPSPVLFIELRNGVNDESETVKDEILRRITPFHERRRIHARIESSKALVVVPLGSLPRSEAKGGILRKIVEKDYKEDLDQIYVSIAA